MKRKKQKSLSQRHLRRWFGHPLEAVLVYMLYWFFRLLPLDMASAFGGWVGRTLGSRLGATKKAQRNLARALPNLTVPEQEKIMVGMWDNLGRVMAEYAHLDELDESRVEVRGQEILEALDRNKQAALLVSGHFANWEVLPVTAAKRGLVLQLVYRQANNPYVDRLLMKARAPMGNNLARKGTEGAKSVFRALREGRMVGMLIDQKYNEGIPVPFFGREAMTAPAVALLALHHKCPIIPIQSERLEGAHFRLTIHPPLAMPTGLSRDEAVKDIMTRLNQQLEQWVRTNPAQWLWLHRRWGQWGD